MMFARRLTPFLILALGWVVSRPSVLADEVIRIMAANISTGSQDYNNGEGNRIFQGLDPDIALVQELNYLGNSSSDIRDWVDMNFGSTFSYFREAGAGIPNGIVSRYPILAAGEWNDTELTDRDFVWAKINIPGDKDLWAISVHFKASSGAANEARRDSQSKQILALIAANIPASDYLVIGGDFNTSSRTEDCINTLSVANQNPPSPKSPGVFITTSPWPVDQAGDGDTNASRGSPYDWVIPDADLNARKTTLVIGTNSFPNGLVYDSRVTVPYTFLPTPIQAADSGAPFMQHMAVMRAFLIPTPAANAAPVIAAAAKTSPLETAPDLYQIVRAASTGLSVTATDDAGESLLNYTWSKASGPAGAVTFSVNGTNAAKNCTATFQAAGDYTLSVTVQDLPGLSITSSVNVRVVQTAGSLVLNPPTATLAVNATQAFTAILTDQFNQTMAGVVSWSTSGGGTVNISGVFTATTAGGPFVVAANSSGFSDTSNVTVTRAPAPVSLANLGPTYDGAAKPVSVTTTPTGRAVSVLYGGSSTPPTDAGSYAVTATITDPNYQGSATGTLVIGKAAATLTLAGLTPTYDGDPKPVTVTTTPAGRSFAILYDGSPTAPSLAGSYAVTATITDPNYQGTASATLVIIADELALWQNTYFTELEQTGGLAADPADPDADGLSNLAEYALGAHPRQFTLPLQGVMEPAGFSLTFTRPADLPGIRYFAEATSDFATWSPVPLEIAAPGSLETMRAFDPFGVDPAIPRFLRLRFERE